MIAGSIVHLRAWSHPPLERRQTVTRRPLRLFLLIVALVVLAGLLPNRASAGCGTYAPLYTSVIFVGRDSIDFEYGVVAGAGCSPEEIAANWSYVLLRDGDVLLRFSYLAEPLLYTDSGLTPGETYTYKWEIWYDNPADTAPPSLYQSATFSRTLDEVSGILRRLETVPEGPAPLGYIVISDGGHLEIQPGAMVTFPTDNPYEPAVEMEGDGQLTIDGALVTGLSLESNTYDNPATGSVSISGSVLEDPRLSIANLVRFEGNVATCTDLQVATLQNIDIFTDESTGPVVLRDNDLSECKVWIGWDQAPSDVPITVQDNRIGLLKVSQKYTDRPPYYGAVTISDNNVDEGAPMALELGSLYGDFEVSRNRLSSVKVEDWEYTSHAQPAGERLIEANQITPGGATDGVWLASFRNVTVRANIIACPEGHSGAGVLVDGQYLAGDGLPTSGNRVVGNHLTNCGRGIMLYGSGTSSVEGTEVRDNIVEGGLNNLYYAWMVENTRTYNNLLIGASYQTVDLRSLSGCGSSGFEPCPNTWNIAKTEGANIVGGPYLGGNFYSEYTGEDADGDWLGDDPCSLEENNVDELPLVGGQVGLTVEHDGHEEEITGTFLQDIPAMNLLSGFVYFPPGDPREVASITFALEDQLETVAAEPFEVDFDMQGVLGDSWLSLTATLDDGTTVQAEYPFLGLPLPYWAESLTNGGAQVDRSFEDDLERYAIEVDNHPADFSASTTIDDSMPLIGGTGCGAQAAFDLDAWFYLTQATEFLGTGNLSGEAMGLSYAAQGEAFAEFDQEFQLLPGAYARSRSRTDIVLDRRFLIATDFEVDGQPLEFPVFLAATGEVNSFILVDFDQAFGIENAVFLPRAEVFLDVLVSMPDLFGPAYTAIDLKACAEADIKLSYSSADGPSMDHFGGAMTLRIGLDGAIFWDEEERGTELIAKVLGPFYFGDGPMKGLDAISPLAACADETHRQRSFLPSVDLVRDNAGRLLLIRTVDVSTDQEPANPEVAVSFDTGEGFSEEVFLTDNDAWEMDPTATFLANGQVLALWTTNDAPHSLSGLKEILAAQDLAWSLFDGDNWSPEGRLTDDDAADGSAAVGYDAALERAMAVWIHDESPSLLDRSGWSLQYALFDPGTGTWSAPAAVPGTGDGMWDFRPRVAGTGRGHFVVSWLRDQDGSLYGGEREVQGGFEVSPESADTDLVWTVFDGSDWWEVRTVTDPDDQPEISHDLHPGPDGQVLFAWVTRDRDRDRLLFRRARVEDRALEAPREVDAAPYGVEDVDLALLDDDRAAITYRRNDGREDELFTLEVPLGTFQPGSARLRVEDESTFEPRRVTRDGGVSWRPATAADADGNLIVAWARTDGRGEDRGGLVDRLSPGVRLAALRDFPGVSLAAAGVVRTLVEEDRIQALLVDIPLAVTRPGTYSVAAELVASNGHRIQAVSTEPTAFDGGLQTVTLAFDGPIIADSGASGPFQVADISIIDHEYSPAVAWHDAGGFETPDFALSDFPPSPLASDEEVHEGEDTPIRFLVRDPDQEASEVVMTLLSSASNDTWEVVLPRVEDGRFEGEVRVSTTESGDDQVLVEPSGVLTGIYEGAGGETWETSVGFLPPPPEPRSLRVGVSPRRAGSVEGEGIDCPSDCFQTQLLGDRVTLTAIPAEGYTVDAWDGADCSGETCTFLLLDDTEIEVTFRKGESTEATPTPVPEMTPTPEGGDGGEGAGPTPGPGASPSPTSSPDDDAGGCACDSRSGRGPVPPGLLGVLALLVPGLVRLRRAR